MFSGRVLATHLPPDLPHAHASQSYQEQSPGLWTAVAGCETDYNSRISSFIQPEFFATLNVQSSEL
jgi:hypothetical protein